MPLVDVVVVAYNSGDELRGCVGPLVGDDEISVVVVDNASPEGGLESLDGLPAIRIPLDYNGGFAHGCNVGIRAGSAPYVLLLNPDTVIQPASVRQLADELAATPELGAVAPRIVYPSGELHLSQRRFPRLRSTFAQALYLNQIFPRKTWASELVRTPADYERRTAPEWVSGACILFPRDLLEALGGLDEGFFLYCEDTDICRRVWDSGRSIRFVPDAEVVHVGGASAPRASLLGVLASSRIRYAAKHRGRVVAELERLGVALDALTHAAVGRGGRSARAGNLGAMRRALFHRASATPHRRNSTSTNQP